MCVKIELLYVNKYCMCYKDSVNLYTDFFIHIFGVVNKKKTYFWVTQTNQMH